MAQETDYQLAVYSSSGQLLLTQYGTGAQLERVDMAGLPAGVYWLRVMGRDILGAPNFIKK